MAKVFNLIESNWAEAPIENKIWDSVWRMQFSTGIGDKNKEQRIKSGAQKEILSWVLETIERLASEK